MLVLPDASRMGYRLRLTNYFLTTMTRRTRCVTVAVGATVRTARQLIHPVREDMLLPRLTSHLLGIVTECNVYLWSCDLGSNLTR